MVLILIGFLLYSVLLLLTTALAAFDKYFDQLIGMPHVIGPSSAFSSHGES